MTDLHDIAEPTPEPRPRGRRTAVVAAVSVAVVAVLGGGAAAAAWLLGGGGTQPEEVLPASTLAEISVDLDPSASQKLEAMKTLRKFPAIDTGLGTGDDLRKWFFDQAVKDTGCKQLDFASDVEPWLGDRAALAAVDLAGKEPAPAVVLQISDQARARTGIQRLVDCGHPGPDFGYAFTDGYVVMSDSADHARTIASSGEQSPLSQDAGFTGLSDRAGDRGVVDFYVAQQAGSYLVDHLADLSGGATAADGTAMAQQVKDFRGLAGAVRFADGGVELSAIGLGAQQLAAPGKAGAAVAGLPRDTAAAVGFSLPARSIQQIFESLSGAAGMTSQQLTAEAETMTGLRLPDDLQTLLGTGVVLSLGGNAPDLASVRGPADIPFGATVLGDPQKISDVLDRVAERQGTSLQQLGISEKSGDGRLVLASSDGYAATLLGKGDLGQESIFTEVVPEADKAQTVEFVDFDSAWLDKVLDAAASSGEDSATVGKLRKNLKPLKALGLSAWVDGDAGHFLLKVTTD
jgi:hypothetical protein